VVSERPEALWTVDRLHHKTGELSKRFVFRTREAARKFRDDNTGSPVYRYLQPVRAQWGPGDA
jgi:hypothetical protein